jgi:hypothetical protein
MSKPVLGLILGAILGMIDGIGAYAYPGVREMIVGIIFGSTFKGLITGLITGFFARKYNNLPLAMLFGLTVGLLLSWLVAATSPDPQGNYYYIPIMLPGSILGAICGFAATRFGRQPAAAVAR